MKDETTFHGDGFRIIYTLGFQIIHTLLSFLILARLHPSSFHLSFGQRTLPGKMFDDLLRCLVPYEGSQLRNAC